MKYRIFLTVAVLFALCLLLAGCTNGSEQADNTAFADICTVTFDTGGGIEIAAQQVAKGDKATQPQDPERVGYTFTGWTYQGQEWIFVGYSVTENITLTAKWEEQLVVSNAGILTGLTEAGKRTDVINIPETYNGIAITSIGYAAFRGYTGLTSVTIPDSVTSIGSSAFSGCTGLTNVVIPDSVTSIGSYAFNGCTGLTSITIPSSVTSIGEYTFHDCTSLTSVTIPDSVTSIGSSAFYGCTGLTSITVTNGNSVYHSAGNCLIETASKKLIIGCSTSAIPTDGSVTSIGGGAFSGCTCLTSVTIPGSVTSIGDFAFYECRRLTSVTFTGTKEQWRAISKGSYWNGSTGVYTVHCTDGDIAK